MATAGRSRVARGAGRGVVSLAAGFAAGFALFVALGATPGDAVFSALSVATVVAVSRTLRR